MNPRNRWATGLMAALILSVLPLLAQDQPAVKQAAPIKESDEAKRSREELRLALEQVAPIRLANAETGVEIERIDHPVFRHSAPLWGGHHGTVWVWGKCGRPVAVLEMFQVLEQRVWYHQFHATADLPIKMRMSNGETWTPKESNVRFQPLAGTPSPAETPSARMRQMKGIVQKITAHQLWSWKGGDGARHELRLLTTPVHRYDDRDQQLIDGALFIIAQGTNPEATLFLEAVARVDEPKPIWQFGIGRTSNAEIFVSYDDQVIHHDPAVNMDEILAKTSSHWRTTAKIKSKESQP